MSECLDKIAENILEVKSILAMPEACQFHVIIQCLLVIEERMLPNHNTVIFGKAGSVHTDTIIATFEHNIISNSQIKSWKKESDPILWYYCSRRMMAFYSITYLLPVCISVQSAFVNCFLDSKILS